MICSHLFASEISTNFDTRPSKVPLQHTWNKPFAMPYQHSRSFKSVRNRKKGSESDIRILLLWSVSLGFTNFSFVWHGKKKSPTTCPSPFVEGKTQGAGWAGRSHNEGQAGWLQVIMDVTRNRSLGWRIRQVNSKFMLNKTHYFLDHYLQVYVNHHGKIMSCNVVNKMA